MRKITLNRTRLSNVLDNRLSFSTGVSNGLGSPMSLKSKNFLNGFNNNRNLNNKRVLF